MRVPTPGELLELRDGAASRHSLDRALDLLVLTHPESSRAELASLPLGGRDDLLLGVRSLLFGDALPVYSECAACGAALEMTLSVRELRAVHARHDSREEYEIEVDGFQVRVRPPNSYDLAAALPAARPYAELLRRCVLKIDRDGRDLESDDLPEATGPRIAEAIGNCDPLSEILLSPRCPECDSRSSTVLDVVRYLWTELASESRRLLEEVHALASRYGWSEREILSMSPVRRRGYLDLILS